MIFKFLFPYRTTTNTIMEKPATQKHLAELQRPIIQIIMRQKIGVGAGAAEKTVTKVTRLVRMLHILIRIPDTSILIKYILSPLATDFVVHSRAMMVDILRNKYSPPFASFRKP